MLPLQGPETKVVRLRKNLDGDIIQGCDLYIGGRVMRGGWILPRSEWSNTLETKCPQKFEEYMRNSRPDLMERIIELDGKTLGCWCSPAPCHGDVLVKLLKEYKINHVKDALAETNMVLLRDSDLEYVANTGIWAQHSLWLAHATRLDDTMILYYTPEMYRAMVEITAYVPCYYEALSTSGMVIYILGVYSRKQPFGPMWSDDLIESAHIDPDVIPLLEFAREAHKVIPVELGSWQASLDEAEKYFSIHRKIVRLTGRVLGVDMEDHDLTKSRIVQLALGYRWHWSGAERDQRLIELADRAIKAGHLEQEDHHPEFKGVLQVDKMFADRVAVHLQKDVPDRVNGWGLNPKFIPDAHKDAWNTFKSKHEHINMYENVLWRASLTDSDFEAFKDKYARMKFICCT